MYSKHIPRAIHSVLKFSTFDKFQFREVIEEQRQILELGDEVLLLEIQQMMFEREILFGVHTFYEERGEIEFFNFIQENIRNIVSKSRGIAAVFDYELVDFGNLGNENNIQLHLGHLFEGIHVLNFLGRIPDIFIWTQVQMGKPLTDIQSARDRGAPLDDNLDVTSDLVEAFNRVIQKRFARKSGEL